MKRGKGKSEVIRRVKEEGEKEPMKKKRKLRKNTKNLKGEKERRS